MNQTANFIRSQLIWALVLGTPVFIITRQVVFSSRTMKLAEVNKYSTDEKRDIYSTFDTENRKKQGIPIDPFDLMNRLKQAGAMDEATTPSDALDEALNAFDQSDYENVQIE